MVASLREFRTHKRGAFGSIGLLPGRYRVEARTDFGATSAFALEVPGGKASLPTPVRLEMR